MTATLGLHYCPVVTFYLPSFSFLPGLFHLHCKIHPPISLRLMLLSATSCLPLHPLPCSVLHRSLPGPIRSLFPSFPYHLLFLSQQLSPILVFHSFWLQDTLRLLLLHYCNDLDYSGSCLSSESLGSSKVFTLPPFKLPFLSCF